eukprot:scaffold2797_cov133-Skeletonema_dohrnii-CCMP3373.AAC.4
MDTKTVLTQDVSLRLKQSIPLVVGIAVRAQSSQAFVSERSKELDSSSSVFALVGSNPTECIPFALLQELTQFSTQGVGAFVSSTATLHRRQLNNHFF